MLLQAGSVGRPTPSALQSCSQAVAVAAGTEGSVCTAVTRVSCGRGRLPWEKSKPEEWGEHSEGHLKVFLVSPLTFFLYFGAFAGSQDVCSYARSLGLHP